MPARSGLTRRNGSLCQNARVPLNPDLTAITPDSSLDDFRDAVAVLRLHGHAVGYLATRVETYAESVGGRLWWTKWSQPREIVEYLMTRTDHSSPLPDWDDNLDVTGSVVDELRTGTTEYLDHRAAGTGSWDDAEVYAYQLDWLDGDERAQAWKTYGFGDTHLT